MTGDLAINMWSNLFALYFNKQTVEEFKRESPYELVKKRQVFIRGWIGNFRAADMKRTMMSLDEWLRRRFRMYIWKQWKKPKMKVTNLRKLGTPADKPYQCGNSRLGYRRIAGSPVLKCSIINQRLVAAGYFSIRNCYESLHLCG